MKWLTNERALAYSEVYYIIRMMNKKYVDKIPKKLKKIIINEMDKNYIPKINAKIPLQNQNLQHKTFTILAMINLRYWCENEKHKQELLKIYNENSRVKTKKLSEKYNYDNLFKKPENSYSTITENNNTFEIVPYKEIWYNKILKVISDFLNKFKKTNN